MKTTDVLHPKTLDEAIDTIHSPQFELEASCWAAMQRKILETAEQESGRRRIGLLFCYQLAARLVELLDSCPPISPSSLEMIRSFRGKLTSGMKSMLARNIQNEAEYGSLYGAFKLLRALSDAILDA